MKRDFRDLIVWKKSIELAVQVYRETSSFPRDERFGLTSQMRRSAVSVPSNVAEGQGRATLGEFRHFLGIAKGSLSELETQVVIATELEFLPKDSSLLSRLREVARLLNGLIVSLR
jgi:four helix bundle protein